MPFGTLQSSDCIREFINAIRTACMIITIFALTGCGYLPFGQKENTQSPVPMPPANVTQTQQNPYMNGQYGNNMPVMQADPQLNMELQGEAPAIEGYTQVPAPPPPAKPMDAVVAAGPLQLGPEGSMGALGVNLSEYFDETQDSETRITKVERAVAAIQNDLKTLAPPIQRLITVERDIQELVSQLAELAEAPPTVTPVSASAVSPPRMIPTQTARPAMNTISGNYQPPSSGGSASVRELRIGEHPDKTRIVLDVNGKPSYRYDLDNGENILVIELPDTSWLGPQQGKPKKSPIVSSYNVYASGNGSRVVIQLKKSTSISYETVLRPNGKKFYRVVLDLKK